MKVVATIKKSPEERVSSVIDRANALLTTTFVDTCFITSEDNGFLDESENLKMIEMNEPLSPSDIRKFVYEKYQTQDEYFRELEKKVFQKSKRELSEIYDLMEKLGISEESIIDTQKDKAITEYGIFQVYENGLIDFTYQQENGDLGAVHIKEIYEPTGELIQKTFV